MKTRHFLLIALFFLFACQSTTINTNVSPEYTAFGHGRVLLQANATPWTNTGVIVTEGDLMVFHVEGTYYNGRRLFKGDSLVYFSIGDNGPQSLRGDSDAVIKASASGEVRVAVKDWIWKNKPANSGRADYVSSKYFSYYKQSYRDNKGNCMVDIVRAPAGHGEELKSYIAALKSANPGDQQLSLMVSNYRDWTALEDNGKAEVSDEAAEIIASIATVGTDTAMNGHAQQPVVASHAAENQGSVVAQQTFLPGPSAMAASSLSKRTALVVGNSEYVTAPLRNPVKDARSVASALNSLGFETTLLLNADRRTLLESLDTFRKKSSGGVALFYFAGHGIQSRGENFLIPVDAVVRSEADMPYAAVSANRVLDTMSVAENSLNIVVLDACRNTPFSRMFRSGGRGLSTMFAPRGTIVAFSTAPGEVATDGMGENSLYARAFIDYVTTPGMPVESFFKEVARSVIVRTNDTQRPWISSDFVGDFYFAGTGASQGDGQQ